MPLFHCKIADNTGKTLEMTREAPNEDVLILEFIQNNYAPIKIKEVKAEDEKIKSGKRFSQNSILEFTQTLSLLLSSGLSLKDALDVNKTIFTKGPINRLTNTLTEKIKKGDSFHQALDKFHGSFPPLYRGLVKIGEKIGTLENIFEKLADYLRESKRIRDKLIGALSYPILTLSFAILGVIGMAIFIFPRIKDIFASLHSSLNEQILSTMAFVNVFFTFGAIILGIIIMLIIIVLIIRKSEGPLRNNLDKIILKLPVIGNIIYIRESLNFLFAMETLTASGFAVEDALPEAGKVLYNRALASGIAVIREKIIKGEHLSTAFLEDPYFDERIGRWVSIGERSGKVEIVFGQLRQYYQDELEKWSTGFMAIVEPALIIIVGLIILFLIMTFFVPIFSIYQGFGT
jgi:type II secretory pathway component PulF